MNKNNKGLISVCILLATFVFLCSFFTISINADNANDTNGNESSNDAEPLYNELISFVDKNLLSIAALIFSIISFSISSKRSKNENVRIYYEKTESENIYHARHLLYKYKDFKNDKNKTVKDSDFDIEFKDFVGSESYGCYNADAQGVREAAYHMANFYQMWGLLQRKGFFPLWVFKTSAGFNLIRLYCSIDDIFDEKKRKNPLYAVEYKMLCKRAYLMYRKKINKCCNDGTLTIEEIQRAIFNKNKKDTNNEAVILSKEANQIFDNSRKNDENKVVKK